MIKVQSTSLIKRKLILLFHFSSSAIVLFIYPEVLNEIYVLAFASIVNIFLLIDCISKQYQLQQLKTLAKTELLA